MKPKAVLTIRLWDYLKQEISGAANSGEIMSAPKTLGSGRDNFSVEHFKDRMGMQKYLLKA